MGLVVAVVVIVLIFIFVLAQQGSRAKAMQQRTGFGPRPGGGSMGRAGEPMPPNQAAQLIYGKLKSQGGVMPGRVYSAGYFQDVMPYPVYSFNQDPYYWQAVFVALNELMVAESFMFPVSPYMYGGQPSFFFGAMGDPGLAPMYYGDPYATSGVPFDVDPNAFVPQDFGAQDFGQQDPGVDFNQPDMSQDPGNFDQANTLDTGFMDTSNSPDFSSNDFDSGGGFDMGDSGGFDMGGDS